MLAEEKLAAQEADIGEIAQQHGLRMLPDLQGFVGMKCWTSFCAFP